LRTVKFNFKLSLIILLFSITPGWSQVPNPMNSEDIKEAVGLLGPGSSTLRGRASAIISGGLLNRKFGYAKNELVYLYPMTKYMNNWNQEHKRDYVIGMFFISPEMHDLTARVITDDDGYFKFRGLKAGKYFLITKVNYKATLSEKNDTGRSNLSLNYFSGVISSTPIYSYKTVSQQLDHHIYKIVEIGENHHQELGEIR